jgi:hypothetical protein
VVFVAPQKYSGFFLDMANLAPIINIVHRSKAVKCACGQQNTLSRTATTIETTFFIFNISSGANHDCTE